MRTSARLAARALIRAALVLVAVFAAFGAATARADTAVLPVDAELPWASPTHESALEQILNPALAQAIGRPAAMHCAGDYEWGLLSAEKSLSGRVWGYVEFWGNSPLGFTEISPQACRYLQAFAQADTKPTKCAPPVTVSPDRAVVTYRTVLVRVKKNGRSTYRHERQATRTTEKVAQPPAVPLVPCFTPAGVAATAMPESYWTAYSSYAMALLTIGHEPFHIAGDMDEARVNCHGLQQISMIAQALGDTPDDAEQIARYTLQYIIPTQPRQYWLPAECHDGGALDLNPGSSVWP